MGIGAMMGMKATWVVASVVLGLLVAQLLRLKFQMLFVVEKRAAELL
jgi:hypothetical protein